MYRFSATLTPYSYTSIFIRHKSLEEKKNRKNNVTLLSSPSSLISAGVGINVLSGNIAKSTTKVVPFLRATLFLSFVCVQHSYEKVSVVEFGCLVKPQI